MSDSTIYSAVPHGNTIYYHAMSGALVADFLAEVYRRSKTHTGYSVAVFNKREYEVSGDSEESFVARSLLAQVDGQPPKPSVATLEYDIAILRAVEGQLGAEIVALKNKNTSLEGQLASHKRALSDVKGILDENPDLFYAEPASAVTTRLKALREERDAFKALLEAERQKPVAVTLVTEAERQKPVAVTLVTEADGKATLTAGNLEFVFAPGLTVLSMRSKS